MTSDEIRERYLSFFEERGHKRIPSASLVPSAHDASALLTVAGMHPLKPYFLGQEQPPAPRLTSCQKVFRTVDIDVVGNTARHLTFFEMLGNFSFGDYFKREAIEFAWQLSREVFGFADEDIWVTVFEGDEALGLGPDEEAIACWRELGVKPERIVECPRSENFWQAGPTGPCGPCSELYIDRGAAYGFIESRLRQNEYVTGLIHIDESGTTEFHTLNQTSAVPLNRLPYEKLVPGRAALEKLLARYR